jgi:hypothetical protein
MDKEIIDSMSNELMTMFWAEWAQPILYLIISGYIIQSLRQINKGRKLMEIKQDAMIYALSSAPAPLGDHFKEHYEKKVAESLRDQNYLG